MDLYVDGRRSIREALVFAARLASPLLAGGAFDVVDCQAFPYFPAVSAKVATLARDTPLLLTWHEVWGDYWYDYLGRPGAVGEVVERVVARLPDAHVAVSGRTAAEARTVGVEDVDVIPNGVDLEHIAAVGRADRDVDVLFVGRLIDDKNVDVLIRAMVGRGRQCLVVGDGPERDRLEALAARIGAPVEFAGFVEDHETVLSLMGAASVLVHPSRREGFGMTVLEALACGTPVVTSDHPRNAASELVDHGTTGYVVAPEADAVAWALERTDGLDRVACAAAAADYDWAAIADRTADLYAEVAAS